jgi:hypothetical protein
VEYYQKGTAPTVRQSWAPPPKKQKAQALCSACGQICGNDCRTCKGRASVPLQLCMPFHYEHQEDHLCAKHAINNVMAILHYATVEDLCGARSMFTVIVHFHYFSSQYFHKSRFQLYSTWHDERAARANHNLVVALPALLRIRMAGVGIRWNMIPTTGQLC